MSLFYVLANHVGRVDILRHLLEDALIIIVKYLIQ